MGVSQYTLEFSGKRGTMKNKKESDVEGKILGALVYSMMLLPFIAMLMALIGLPAKVESDKQKNLQEVEIVDCEPPESEE